MNNFYFVEFTIPQNKKRFVCVQLSWYFRVVKLMMFLDIFSDIFFFFFIWWDKSFFGTKNDYCLKSQAREILSPIVRWGKLEKRRLRFFLSALSSSCGDTSNYLLAELLKFNIEQVSVKTVLRQHFLLTALTFFFLNI